jgi:hypothetical protein
MYERCVTVGLTVYEASLWLVAVSIFPTMLRLLSLMSLCSLLSPCFLTLIVFRELPSVLLVLLQL